MVFLVIIRIVDQDVEHHAPKELAHVLNVGALGGLAAASQCLSKGRIAQIRVVREERTQHRTGR